MFEGEGGLKYVSSTAETPSRCLKRATGRTHRPSLYRTDQSRADPFCRLVANRAGLRNLGARAKKNFGPLLKNYVVDF